VNGPDPRVLAALLGQVEDALTATRNRPVVIGIAGSQGSGKTTLARAAVEACKDRGLAAAMLSIDDLYLTRAEREGLARDVHPLLATRGVPGTHDGALGLAVFDALGRGEGASLPRFDKARDDRMPPDKWPKAPEQCEVLIFEGWCVGARPQRESELAEPVNDLEASEDPQCVWRHYVNDALGGSYQDLFGRIDRLVMLAAPAFDAVFDWRVQQEDELREQAGIDAPAVMNAAAVARFIQHYERLTRHMLSEMPDRADVLVRLDQQRRPVEITASR